MSNDDFETHLATLQAIPHNAIKSSSIPIGIYAQEAENLYHWAKKDLAALQGAGLTEDYIEQLSLRVDLLRIAEARWQAEYQARKEATAEWAEKSPGAYALRDSLLRAMRYAFRNKNDLLQRVSAVAEGDSHADMIQDLATLAVLGKQQKPLLEAIHFDTSLLQEANSVADTMSVLLALANGDKLEGNDGRTLRDQAFTYLKEIVDEVRACGKYVFFNHEARLKGYSSAFLRNQNKRSRSVAAGEPSESSLSV
ncbi:hypothetical protein P886_3448 [Alteromonadaceae bacterium 2753L.S.0a.02]|nr:hypothetical protein P886_3448 [Alteromonadaceae bacterium 2753L.S.0a.02]